ncbi:MAG: tRNA 4-thiouridine(8) synthase ThiI [Clostridia bacterium]|nr:tRNA 4-thiouridine(8) synthase ThiI [Clostridia bacterium]
MIPVKKFKEILLCKYGEIILKGANRKFFEDTLLKELRRRSARFGRFDIYYSQSTIYIVPLDEESDLDGMYASASKVFGIVAITRAAECEKNMDAILELAKTYIPDFLTGASTFKCDARRSDKTFEKDSMEISAEVGGALLEVMPHLKVDVHHPDITVRIEIREQAAYIHAGQQHAAGGMPVGSNGKGLLLLSGGIDSPVAGYMMAKRGMRLEAVHFESFPYTSELAREKVFRLADQMSDYTGNLLVHVVSLTHIQEVLMRDCEEDYFTLLLRRFMMRIASEIAIRNGCKALITGESLGQVASQTIEAITSTEDRASLPVLRPCIGLDKEEIIQISRRIGTFDISIEPYEDCCTVFTPRHPRTKPDLEKVRAQEAKTDFDTLVGEALESAYRIWTGPDRKERGENHG